jgi:hypothetical protein
MTIPTTSSAIVKAIARVAPFPCSCTPPEPDRGEKVPGYAPPPDKEAKWKALTAVGSMPKWNGTMKGVMTCLIQWANYFTGKCCPMTWTIFEGQKVGPPGAFFLSAAPLRLWPTRLEIPSPCQSLGAIAHNRVLSFEMFTPGGVDFAVKDCGAAMQLGGRADDPRITGGGGCQRMPIPFAALMSPSPYSRT